MTPSYETPLGVSDNYRNKRRGVMFKGPMELARIKDLTSFRLF